MLIRPGILAAALWVALAPQASQAQPPEQDFEQANRLYEQSQYEAAIERYEKLVQLEPLSSSLRYNLANAYFRSAKPGNLGRAIASYERAFELDPRDANIRYNLDFALRGAGESLIPPGIPTALFVLFHGLSGDELAALHWLSFWICLLIASVYALSDMRRRVLRPYLWGAGAVWLALASWWGLRRLAEVQSPGVVLAHEAEVRSGPGSSFPVSFKAPEGRRVSILDHQEGWVEIGVLKEGLKGWLPEEEIERI